MGSNIIFSANNNEEVVILPVVPPIKLDRPQSNQKFETINNGTLNLIGEVGLYEFPISSIFPAQQYPWLKPGSVAKPMMYVVFFNKYRRKQVPFRCIASRPDGVEWFNMPVLVDDFQYYPRANGDIVYDLELSEYRFA